jgi:hypothetical protein
MIIDSSGNVVKLPGFNLGDMIWKASQSFPQVFNFSFKNTI